MIINKVKIFRIFSRFHTIFVFAGHTERMHGIWIRSQFWINHPAYAGNEDQTYDIAMVKLEKSFRQRWVERGFTAAINPICLPKQSNNLNKAKEQAVFFGYGGYGDEKSHFLRKMNLTIMEEDRDITCYQKSMICVNVTGFVQKTCPVSTLLLTDYFLFLSLYFCIDF